jgi:hypothetical protein
MTTLVNLEKVDQSILLISVRSFTPMDPWIEEHTTDAAKDPFSHLLLCPINSVACSGTSVSAFEGLT